MGGAWWFWCLHGFGGVAWGYLRFAVVDRGCGTFVAFLCFVLV